MSNQYKSTKAVESNTWELRPNYDPVTLYIVTIPGEKEEDHDPVTFLDALEIITSSDIGDKIEDEYREGLEGPWCDDEFEEFVFANAFRIARENGWIIQDVIRNKNTLKSASSLVFFVAFIGLMSACGPKKCSTITCSVEKKKVLVIGDSVSMGWTPVAALKSENDYIWQRLTLNQWSSWPENARNTNYTLRNVNTWLDQYSGTDVVLWNNGIWNATQMGYVTPGEDPRNYGTSLEQYESELIQIAKILKSRVPRVVFITTTDLGPATSPLFEAGKEVQFNAIAKRVLPPLGIEIVDMNALVLPHPDWHIEPKDVHFNGNGIEYMSELIVHQALGVK